MPDNEIITFLQKNLNARLECEDRWLVWGTDDWIVYYRSYRARNTTELYRGENLKEALQVLEGD